MSFAGLAAVAVIVDAVAGAQRRAAPARARVRRREADGGRRPRCQLHEVRSPLTYATFIALPRSCRSLSWPATAFFEPLVLAYALGVATAMVVAMTVAPALCSCSRADRPRDASRRLHATRPPPYGAALAGFMRRPRAVSRRRGACLVGAVVLLAVLPLLGTSLIPSFKDRDLLVRLNAEPGTSNTRMTEIATQVSRELRSTRASQTSVRTSGAQSPVTASSTSTPPTSW